MSEELFPSGPWVGFYTYASPADKHRMDLHLTFSNGQMTGDGNDDVGRFLVAGRYDGGTLECYWTKTYPGSHEVSYRGFREGKGIWGTWEITPACRGGFHIWPRGAGEGVDNTEAYSEPEPVDAVAEFVAPASQKGAVLLRRSMCLARALASRLNVSSKGWIGRSAGDGGDIAQVHVFSRAAERASHLEM